MILLVIIFLIAFPICSASAETAVASTNLFLPTEFQVFDTPNDAGDSISLTWPVSSMDSKELEYIIYISKEKDKDFKEALRIKANTNYKSDAPQLFGISEENQKYHFIRVYSLKVYPPPRSFVCPKCRMKQEEEGKCDACNQPLIKDTSQDKKNRRAIKECVYYFKIGITDGKETLISDKIASVQAHGNIFNWSKTNNFILMIIFSAIVLWFISRARKGKELYLRKIAGIEAVEEAVGRATEMGKTVLFVHGLGTMADIATIAAVNILGKIARKIASYDAILKVTNNDPIVLAVSQETVKNAYIDAGRPDSYREDNVIFVAAQQFSYVAAVDGMMLRERPAANLYMGSFAAEALLLTEGGSMAGAIQIAATDSYTQLPFFVTTCDYTLMGEELYAASAYLSSEPKLLGSLKGQDAGKAFIIIVLILGTVLVSFFGLDIIRELLKAF